MPTINMAIPNDITLGTVASTGTYTSPLTILGGSVIAPGTAIDGPNTQGWTVDNLGVVSGTGAGGVGILLGDGGTAENKSTSARISGDAYGVHIEGATGTIVNDGTMIAADGSGVALDAGGSVANSGSTALISGELYGVRVAGAAGYVTNSGTITATFGDAVALQDGGSVTNAATGLIDGGFAGVYVAGAAASVTNYGTITATETGSAAVYFHGSFAETFINAGVITDTGDSSDAVKFGSGDDRLILDPGSVITGTVDGGAGNNTLEFAAGAGYGAITGLAQYLNFSAITVDAGGYWTLPGYNTIISGQTVTINGTLSNPSPPETYGTLTVSGTLLDHGRFVNYGTVTGTGPVIVEAGTLVNHGTIAVTTTLDSGGYLDNSSYGPGIINVANQDGVLGTGGPSTVVNNGTISASGVGQIAAIALNAGGIVTNDQYGVITGTSGVIISGAAGTVINFGNIAPSYGESPGVDLSDGGSVVNGPSGATTASISGFSAAVVANYVAATVTNYATITGTAGIGVSLTDGGSVNNEGAAAQITGGYYGILIKGAAGTVVNSGQIAGARPGGSGAARIGVKFSGAFDDTLTNAGTIAGSNGGDAVLFGAGNDRLILDPGAVFTGIVDGGAGSNTLELASAAGSGTITGFSNTFVNFGTVIGDAGASWTFGANNTIASGTALTLTGSLGVSGALTALGTLTNSGTLAVSGTLTDLGTVANSGTVTITGTLLDDGVLTNTGVLTGTGTLDIGSVTFVNDGSIGATVTLLSGSYLDNASTSTITDVGRNAVVGSGGPVSVVNAGTITATGAAASGIFLLDGGTATNSGTVSGDYIGVGLFDGGAVTNSTTGLIEGGDYGVRAYGTLASVTNLGTIAGVNAGAGVGVWLKDGGTVGNGASGVTTATITGEQIGVIIGGGSSFVSGGLVTNYGTIGGGLEGVEVNKGGTVDNDSTSAVISGSAFGIYVTHYLSSSHNRFGGIGTIGNLGTIEATSAAGDGVYLGLGGDVRNGAVGITTALIEGGDDGVDIGGTLSATGTSFTSDTVVNYGTIIGNGGAGGGANGAVISNLGPAALISGGKDGVDLSAVVATLGTVPQGNLALGGTLTNTGSIFGGNYGVHATGGTIVNGGSGATGARIEGGNVGIYVEGGPSTVANYGTIIATGNYTASSYGDGILVKTDAGENVTNGASGATTALITGADNGIVFLNRSHSQPTGNVTNYGTISGVVGVGLMFGNGGTAINGASNSRTAVIEGGATGIYVANADYFANYTPVRTFPVAGTVTNFGTIEATASGGIGIEFTGSIVNHSGTALAFGDTVLNAGTIAGHGGDAILFGVGDDLLVVDPGAVFVGTVDGGAGNNTLELASAASTGTITGLGTSFVNFGPVVVDAGARWVLTGANTVANGVTVDTGGSVVNDGTIIGTIMGANVQGGATLSNLGSAALISGGRTGVYLGAIAPGGTLVSGATVVNTGTITGSLYALFGQAGSVTNGDTAATGARIEGGGAGVYLVAGPSTITNYGTIVADQPLGVSYGAGIVVGYSASDTIDNGAGGATAALIAGPNYGIFFKQGNGVRPTDTVVNDGTIAGATGDGIFFGNGGSAINGAGAESTALITGGTAGIYINAGRYSGSSSTSPTVVAQVTNFGTIEANAAGGVGIKVAGSIVNTGGTIVPFTDTVTNAGTIAGSGGGDAILFGTGNDLLIVDPGAVFVGTVDGGAGDNTLELASAASTGTISGIGSSFVGFGTVAIDSGASWVLNGANTIAAGVTLTNAGTATISGTLTNLGSIDNQGALILSGSQAHPTILVDSGTISGAVAFAAGVGNDAMLRITNTAALPETIVGFTGENDFVDLTQISDAGNDAVASLNTITNVLTVTGDNGSVQLQLDAENYSAVAWGVFADGSGGSDVAILGPPTVTEALVSDDGASASDEITTDPALTGGGDADTTVTITEGLDTLGTVTANDAGVWSFTPTGLADGSHTLSASETNRNGTRTVSLTVTLDTTAPTVAITSSGGPTNQPAQTVSGTVNDPDLPANATVTLFDNGTQIGTTTETAGAWNDAITLSGEGTHSITAQATDLAGNTGTSGADTLTLDTTPPTVTISGSGGLTNQSAQTISGTVGDTNLPADATVTLFDNGTQIGTTTETAGAWSDAITLSGDGTHSITAQATDPAGNTGTSGADTLTLDATPPALTITSAGGFIKLLKQTITGTIGDTHLPDNATVTLFDNGTQIGTTTETAGAWSDTITLSGDGTHSITAQATDLAGNTGTSGADTLTLDTTPPVLTITSAGGLTNQPAQTISGTVSDANLPDNATITLFDNGTEIGTTTETAGAWSDAITLSGEGVHSITALTRDLAGNLGTSSADTLTLDVLTANTPPPVTTPASLTVAGNSTAQAIGITAPTDALPLTITATGLPTDGTVFLSDGTTPVSLSEVLTTGQLTGLEFQPTPGLFATSSSFTYSAEDAAGNSTGGTATLVIAPAPATITSVAPSLATGDLDAGSSVSITLAMSGAVTVSGVPTLTLNDQGGTATYDAAKSTATALVFDYTVAAGENIAALAVMAVNLPNGATIIDSNGNAADLDLPASATFNGLQIDTTAPATSPASLTVDGNSAATAIGIAAPTDASPLTITATGLPTDGTVFLSDGTTPITEDEVLTAAQLTGLDFTPTPGLFDTSSSFAYSVVDAAGNSAAGSAALAIAAQSPSVPADLTGDGVTDTLMTNTVGALVLDEVSGGQMGYTQIGGLGPEWQFEGVGAFLPGENEGELLWNSNSGVMVVAEDVGGTAQYTAIGGVGPEWQFEGNGALLGHGQDDFLIWDGDSASSSYGALVVGEVSGGTAAFTQIGGIGPEWQFKGVGDYLGDGNAAFLIESSNTGALVVGEDAGGAAQYTQIGGLGPEWQFEGSGNLLGHGQDDFLIWDGSSASPQFGALVVGEVTGGVTQYTQIGAVGPEWQFLGVGNYDGASPAEFLMRSATTGALVIGTVANDTATYTQVGGVGPEWNFHTTNPATLV